MPELSAYLADFVGWLRLHGTHGGRARAALARIAAIEGGLYVPADEIMACVEYAYSGDGEFDLHGWQYQWAV